MKIAILGHKGQIGASIKKNLPTSTYIPFYPDIDITDAAALESYLTQTHPEIILNAAAYTNVNCAENEKDLAFAINAEAPERIARIARKLDSLLVHYSTDYVFNGRGNTPWTEESPTDPLNIYGASKASGDKKITESGCRHLILRTSWIYSHQGRNFVQKIIDLANTKDEIDVVCDQIGAPTSAKFIAETTIKMIPQMIKRNTPEGLYNICNAGETSWAEFAEFIFTELEINCKVNHILSSAQSNMPARPLNSRLDITKIKNTLGINPAHWTYEIRNHLHEMGKN